MATVRICVCGDDGVGKSSIIASLVKDVFVTNRIQAVLPQITLPPTLGTPDNVTTIIVDTSADPQERTDLRKEARKCNVILLVYSDHYSYERVSLFWMPYFRSLGVNVPVILCANKSDLSPAQNTAQVVEDEMLPVMAEFKEIDSCIRTSAREHRNINEVFFLCQKAVAYPVAPLFDSKELTLKPAAIAALRRVFHLCDKDQDGLLNDREVRAFQQKVFDKELSDDDLAYIKRSVHPQNPGEGSLDDSLPSGIDEEGFLTLNRTFVEKGRHETLWMILRKFHYTDSLSLKESFLHPDFDVPPSASAELSPTGYRFFVDLFLRSDKDNDGGLNDKELRSLFLPTPGLPPSWIEADFPECTVRNNAGHVTLQGWLAIWSMTTFTSPKSTLEYLAYLGFEPPNDRTNNTCALKMTKPRRRRGKGARPQPLKDRNVFLAYVLGASHAGKSSLLECFLSRPFSPTYNPTIRPRTAVNSVELQGGKQCYLILTELGELEPAIVENTQRLDAADLVCYAYDSSDPDSFAHVRDLRDKHPALHDVPAVWTALKADRDRAVQRSDIQPEQYCADLGAPAPIHVSVLWGSISELFVQLAEASTDPGSVSPRKEGEDDTQQRDWTRIYVGGAIMVGVASAAILVWRRNWISS